MGEKEIKKCKKVISLIRENIPKHSFDRDKFYE